jgi:hypothetical protein
MPRWGPLNEESARTDVEQRVVRVDEPKQWKASTQGQHRVQARQTQRIGDHALEQHVLDNERVLELGLRAVVLVLVQG